MFREVGSQRGKGSIQTFSTMNLKFKTKSDKVSHNIRNIAKLNASINHQKPQKCQDNPEKGGKSVSNINQRLFPNKKAQIQAYKMWRDRNDNKNANDHSQGKTRQNSKSLFVTEHDAREKTKVLWRHQNSQQIPSRSSSHTNVSLSNISLNKAGKLQSIKELDRLKNLYRKQILRSKSQQEIFEENIKMITTIQDSPPKVDAWNLLPKKKKKSRLMRQYEEEKELLFAKNMEMIQKIEDTPPRIDAWNYYRRRRRSPRAIQREIQEERLFEQNMNMIEKIENTPPKVDAWNFRKKKKVSRSLIERREYQEDLFQQNMKMIDKIENTPPKVEPWLYNKKQLEQKVRKSKKFINAENLQKMRLFILEESARLQDQQRRKRKNRLEIIPQEKKKISHQRNKTLPAKFKSKKVQPPRRFETNTYRPINNKFSNISNINTVKNIKGINTRSAHIIQKAPSLVIKTDKLKR